MMDGGMRLVLLGPPGSGKGTQAERLAERLAVPTISTGDMARVEIESGSELGREIEQTVASGALVEDEVMARLVRWRLAEPDADAGFLLDGYPRTLPQADTLASILMEQGKQLDGVLMIDVQETELLRRLLDRQRADDKEEIIRRRLEVYYRQTRPLVGHYRNLGLLREIDGQQSVGEVETSIVGVLESMGQGVA
jgi:adenylate kinase